MPSVKRRSRSRMSECSTKCMRPGPIGRNPYLNFLREFRKKCCGMSARETIQQGAKAWNKLTASQRRPYIEKAFYAPIRRQTMNKCGPTSRRSSRRTSRRSSRRRGVKRASRSRSKSRRRVSKTVKTGQSESNACQKTGEQATASANLKVSPVRRTTRMAQKGRVAMCQNTEPKTKQAACPSACPSACPTTTTKPKRCMRPGPKQRNPYLNFLREFRKNNCGLTPVETIRRGAQAWNALTKEQRAQYIVEAFYTRNRRTLRNVSRRGRRRSGKSKSPARSRRRTKRRAYRRKPKC